MRPRSIIRCLKSPLQDFHWSVSSASWPCAILHDRAMTIILPRCLLCNMMMVLVPVISIFVIMVSTLSVLSSRFREALASTVASASWSSTSYHHSSRILVSSLRKNTSHHSGLGHPHEHLRRLSSTKFLSTLSSSQCMLFACRKLSSSHLPGRNHFSTIL